jgi:hypothetical protein
MPFTFHVVMRTIVRGRGGGDGGDDEMGASSSHVEAVGVHLERADVGATRPRDCRQASITTSHYLANRANISPAVIPAS